MYHLFVSSSADTWRGQSASLLLDRCLRSDECTPAYMIDQYCAFTDVQNELLTQVPAVFACESILKQDARIGRLLSIKKDGLNVRVDYQFLDGYPPVPNDILNQLSDVLGIESIELHRGHWALKNQNLSDALKSAGYPEVPFVDQPLVNIRQHVFDVALSFPGEVRDFTEAVARQLRRVLGCNSVFYDNFYKSQLAAPNLDTILQDIYRTRSRLVVCFLSEDYAGKKWCGIEYRAIRSIINDKRDEKVMFIRFDDAQIDGVFAHDGYINAKLHSAIEVASMIHERVRLLRPEA